MGRFDRQTALPDVDQGKLATSSVLVVGAGGLGSPVIQYLAGAGLKRIHVCDHDKVDETNLHRQVLYTDADIGKSKASLACERIKAVGVEAVAFEEPFQEMVPLLTPWPPYDVILDCTDRWSSHDAVVMEGLKAKVPVVHGSIWGLLGRVMVFSPTEGPCWRCVHPERPEGVKNAPKGTLGPVCGVIGSLMGFEALRILLGWGIQHSRMAVYDARKAQMTNLSFPQDPKCPSHKREER